MEQEVNSIQFSRVHVQKHSFMIVSGSKHWRSEVTIFEKQLKRLSTAADDD